jgi:predicted ArsR family transcriptional regulator
VTLFDPTRPHAFAGPTDTSRRTAERIMPRTGSTRRAILNQLIELGPRFGATDQELQHALGISGDTVRPRRVELVEDGWVTDSGRRRPTPSGHDAIVWVPTEAAMESASAERHR